MIRIPNVDKSFLGFLTSHKNSIKNKPVTFIAKDNSLILKVDKDEWKYTPAGFYKIDGEGSFNINSKILFDFLPVARKEFDIVFEKFIDPEAQATKVRIINGAFKAEFIEPEIMKEAHDDDTDSTTKLEWKRLPDNFSDSWKNNLKCVYNLRKTRYEYKGLFVGNSGNDLHFFCTDTFAFADFCLNGQAEKVLEKLPNEQQEPAYSISDPERFVNFANDHDNVEYAFGSIGKCSPFIALRSLNRVTTFDLDFSQYLTLAPILKLVDSPAGTLTLKTTDLRSVIKNTLKVCGSNGRPIIKFTSDGGDYIHVEGKDDEQETAYITDIKRENSDRDSFAMAFNLNFMKPKIERIKTETIKLRYVQNGIGALLIEDGESTNLFNASVKNIWVLAGLRI